jgi:hypothetical protein
MYSGDAMDNAVLFVDFEGSDELRDRLQPERLVWHEHREGKDFVAVSLRSQPEDLAALLRTVESWIAERGLPALRFELDGRLYTLLARASALSPVSPA